jgi:hypothetical protein
MRLSLLLLSGLWLSVSALVQAQDCVDVEGIAVIEQGDIAFARQMAIRDGFAQAVLTSKVQVHAQAETQNFQLMKQTAQFVAQQRVTHMKIIEEAREGNTLKLAMTVCLSDAPKACPNYIARYAPKVAVASVAVQDVYSAKDILDLATGYQSEVFNRLWSHGLRNAELVAVGNELYAGQPIVPNLSSPLFTQLADKNLAQFVLLSVVRSLDWETQQSSLGKEMRRYFNYEKEPNDRTVHVDWYLVDVQQQRIFMQGQAFKRITDEDVRVGRDKPFGSRQFFITPTGRAFDYVLEEEVKSVIEKLACEPISMMIAEIDKDKVIVPMSIDTGVQPGDVLAVYSKSSRTYRINGLDLGTDLEPTAFLRVQKVLPKFIVGTFEGKKGLVQAGDLVKSW